MDILEAFRQEQRWRNLGEGAIKQEMERRLAKRFAAAPQRPPPAPVKPVKVDAVKPLVRDHYQPSNADLEHYGKVQDWLERDR